MGGHVPSASLNPTDKSQLLQKWEQGLEDQFLRGTLPMSSWLKDTAKCHLDLEATQEVTKFVMGGGSNIGGQLSHLRAPKKKRNRWNKTLEL